MQINSTCPKCGNLLSSESPHGLCPACLLYQASQPDTLASAGQLPFIPPAIEELAPHFPQLEMLELLGKGGMGAVYKARQRQLDRLVALKILPPSVGGGAWSGRFTSEAKALAKLNHPGIVTIHEFGKAGDLFYFIMEYVDGMNLRQLLRSNRISPREALAIVPQICDALQFAHDHGIVHRDIKPENILLDRKSRVKIADFGLAKLMDAAIQEEPMPAGTTMGTPRYMAPEQRDQPNEVDHRSDIYALGVVFYQMLTGSFPDAPVEPPSRRVSVDVRVDQVVLRALEAQPNLRFQQAVEMKTRVESISQSRTKNPALIFAAMLAAVLIGAAFWPFHPKADAHDPVSAKNGTELTQEGWQLWQSGKPAEAIARFKSATEQSPENADAWNGLGWALFNSGKGKEAEKPFKEAIKLAPDHPGASNGLGQIYLVEGRFTEAEEYLLRAAPQAPAAWFGLARLYMLEGRYTDAETWLRKISDAGQADKNVRTLQESAQKKQLPEGLRLLISPPSYTKAYPAIEASLQWLAEIDAGSYAQSWNDASSFFRQSITQEMWISLAQSARKPFGTIVSRTLAAFENTKTLPGAPDGEYIVIQFKTEFSLKKDAIETITFLRDKDGQWRCSGYFIR